MSNDEQSNMTQDPQSGTSSETQVDQKVAARQKLAVALMAVGGTLVAAAAIWFGFFRSGSGQ
jgi:hypothetical protein